MEQTWASMIRMLPFIATQLLFRPLSLNALSDSSGSVHSTDTLKRSIISKTHLLKQAEAFRSSLKDDVVRVSSKRTMLPSHKDLFYDSAYQQYGGEDNVRLRGFCNWLIPNKVMIGQYPAQTPEVNGASLVDAQRHIHSMIHKAKIRTFCSLQSEIPAQDNIEVWRKAHGQVFLEGITARQDFPHYFSHYEPLVQETLKEQLSKDASDLSTVSFLHAPILDLNTPSSESLYTLLSTLLDQLNPLKQHHDDCIEEKDLKDFAIYIHCWGGRGRAGLVGACLLAILYPELEAKDCLDWVQKGYDTRLGASSMPLVLQRSPQTSSQHQFVHDFMVEIRSLK